MTAREYDGDPIDASWSDAPWVGDGETIDVVDSDGDGEVTVDADGKDLFPKPWEPTEEQVARARWLLLNTDMSGRQLADRAGATISDLSERVRGETDINPKTPGPICGNGAGDYRLRTEVDNSDDANRSNDTTTVDQSERAKLSEDEVLTVRKRLLNGETRRDIAADMDVHETNIGDYAAGRKSVDPDGLNIEYDRVDGWVLADGQEGKTEQVTLRPDRNDTPDTDTVRAAPARRKDSEAQTARTAAAFVLGVVVSVVVRRLFESV